MGAHVMELSVVVPQSWQVHCWNRLSSSWTKESIHSITDGWKLVTKIAVDRLEEISDSFTVDTSDT